MLVLPLLHSSVVFSKRRETISIDALSVRQSSVQRRLSPKGYYDVLFACDLVVLSRACIPSGLVRLSVKHCNVYFNVHLFYPLGLGVTIEPSVLVVLNQNEDVTLTCQPSQGMMVNDNYQIVFLQNEVVVQNSSDNTYNITYVDEMSVSDGGVYRCTINGMNSMSTVEVIFAPSITDNPVDAFATSNDRVELVCTAVGSPPPNITWYRLDDGLGMEPFDSVEEIEANNRDLPVFSDINSTNAIDFTTTSTLTIDPVQFMDFGDYICVAILEDELNDTALSTNFTLPLFADSNIVSITGKIY